MRKNLLLLVLMIMPTTLWAQSKSQPAILVLRTYHMANPGHDIHEQAYTISNETSSAQFAL